MSRRFQGLVLSIYVLGSALAAQSRGSMPEQSPRKALVEMLLGGEDAIKKHLTLEVQRKIGDLLSSPTSAGVNPIQMWNVARAAGSDNLEIFEAGPVVFSYDDPAHHQKLVVRIDGDDLRGGEDQMRLSLHSFRNGAEGEMPGAIRFTLSWKAQQNVWRLNAVTLSATLPVGDPRLFDPARWNLPAASSAGAAPSSRVTPVADAARRAAITPSVVDPAATANSATTERTVADPVTNDPQAHPSSAPGSANDSPKMTPVRALRLIGLAEDIYAQKHPGIGFTCFLSELVNVGRGFDDGEPYKFMDPEFAHGVYNSYRFSLAGCGGSPVKSFQVTAEPVSGAGRAYCSDATHALRGSDDGNGANCLASGKIVQR